MSKVRLRLIITLSFALLAAILLGVFFGVPRGGNANAINYYPTTIFSQGTGGDVGASEAEEGETSFVKFSFSDDGNVYFRRDLALKWYASALPPAEEDASDESTAFTPTEGAADAGIVQYFTMTFAFAPAELSETLVESMNSYICPRCGATFATDATECPTCNFSTSEVVFFDRYEIVLESAEENISKAAKSTNAIVFEAQADGTVKAGIKTAALYAAEDSKNKDGEAEEDKSYLNVEISAEEIKEDIHLALGTSADCGPGEFVLTIAFGEGEAKELGKLTNIGGNFLEYRSSASSTPSTPVTFHTTLAEEKSADESKTYDKVKQQVLMKELNGQTFEITDGKVDDNAPAVLVLNEEVYSFTLGQRYNLTTEAIDVCDDSVSVVRSYYMLRTEEDSEFNHIPTDDDYSELTTSKYFLPAQEGGAQESQYVSIRYILRDGRFDKDSDYGYVYLTWYAAKKEGVVETFANEDGTSKIDMILVENNDLREDPIGPYYVGVTANKDKTDNDVDHAVLDKAVEQYQTELTNIANSDKTSAGNGAYIYLPSFRGLIESNYADYRNLRFSISYKKENSSTSASTETSLRYNNLRFQIDVDGRYVFKVLASDAAGNAMKLYVDKELVDVTTSNVWDIDAIPTFSFDVTYKGADVTEPGEQDPASRGSSYSLKEFEIIDLGNNIKEYTLFYFDISDIPAGEIVPSYSEYVENAKEYSENTYKDYLSEIREYNSDITEEDDAWENTDNDYHWNPDSSLSFVPQKSGIYVVRLTYYDLSVKTESGIPTPENYYEVIEVRNPYDYIPAKSDWLANNVTSVVLFSISAALAVAIVVLFVVKPSDKKVEEVDLGKLKGKKNEKNKK